MYTNKTGGLNIKDKTNAPLRIQISTHLNVSAEEAFELVTKKLPVWIDQVPSLEWDHRKSEKDNTFGKGSIRICAFDGKKLVEDIVHWEENRIYAYSVDMEKSTAPMPIKDHLGIFTIESHGNNRSKIEWTQYFNTKYFIPGFLVAWGMKKSVMDKAMKKLVSKTNM